MDEVLIRIDVESDPAVVGIEKVERALKDLNDEQGRVASASDKYNRDEMGRFKAREKAQVSELERYKTGAKTISAYRGEIEKLTGSEIKRRSKLSEAAKQEPAEVMKVYHALEEVQRLRAQMSQEVLGQTGKTVSEITRMGKTIESVAKQEKKAAEDALVQAQRVADGRARIDKTYNDSSIKRTRESLEARSRMAAEFDRRAAALLAMRGDRFAQDMRGGGSSGATVSGASMLRRAQQDRMRADEAAYLAENGLRSLEDRNQSNGGGGFFSRFGGLFRGDGGGRGVARGGGRGRSRNPFIDTGGSGIQPRNLLMGPAIGLGVAAAGPVGLAAGGLLGAIPGAVFGLGSAFAALKMSGLGQVAQDAAKIRNIQAEMATGAIKEAKGRAQINAMLLQMTGPQKQALVLWQSFAKITDRVGGQVTGILLPAFGLLGKAMNANSGAIGGSIMNSAHAMGGLLTNLSKFISAGPGKVLFAGTASAGNTFINGLMKSLGDLGKSFFAIGGASQDFMKKIMNMSTSVTGSLASWSTSSKGQGDLKTFFAGAAKEIPIVIGLVVSLGKILFSVLKGSLPYANQLLVGLKHMLDTFNAFLNSSRGQADMKAIFDTIKIAVLAAISVIKTIWPVVGTVFGAIQTIIKTTADMFGTKFAVAFSLVAAFFAYKLLAPVQKGLGAIATSMLKAAATNPWVLATAAVGLLVYKLVTAKTAMEDLAQKAQNAADQIRGAFQAAADKGNKHLSLNTLKAESVVQLSSIGSANVRRTSLEAKGRRDGFTPALNAEINQATLALARAREAYATTRATISDTSKSIKADNKTIADSTKKAADDAHKALKDAFQANNTGHIAGRAVAFTLDTTQIGKAKKDFAQAFLAINKDTTGLGQRVSLVMSQIVALYQRTGKLPSAKMIRLWIQDDASLPLLKVAGLINKIHDKTFDIIAHNAQALESINQIARDHIGDKHFNIIGAIVNPRPGNSLDPRVPGASTHRSTGGKIPGMGASDVVPAMLTPGEVVLNRRQQYDFGGPQVFESYFGSANVRKYARGGFVGPQNQNLGALTISGAKNNVATPTGRPIYSGNTGTPPPMLGSADAEPDMQGVLDTLASSQAGINMWTKLKASAHKNWTYYKDNVLHKDYNRRTDLQVQLDNLSGKKHVTPQRVAIRKKQASLAKKILDDQQKIRHYAEDYSQSGRNLRAIKKTVFTKIPGYDAFENVEVGSDDEQLRLSILAATMPALDPNAAPDAPNGLNTLTGQWAAYNTQFAAQEKLAEGGFQARTDWLSQLIPSLKSRPKFQLLARNELRTDRQQWLSTIGRSLADTVPSGAGPGDVITGTGGSGGGSGNTWADQPASKGYTSQMAQDAAQAAYALISNDPNAWLSAMMDEKSATWTRIQQLQGAKDFPPFASFRNDILDEITSDSGTYTSIVQAIQGGFASATGSGSSNSAQVQEALNAANTIMSQINLGSTVEREQLGLLSGFLKSQVPSYETGAQYVGKTGLAMVHQGERITARGDVGGGGTTHVVLHGGDSLTDALVQHLEPKITYQQGQSARRRIRERRR